MATAVGGIPEIVDHGKNGLLVPAKASSKLVEAIITFLKNDEFRKQLGANGLHQCRKRFMVSGTIEKL